MHTQTATKNNKIIFFFLFILQETSFSYILYVAARRSGIINIFSKYIKLEGNIILFHRYSYVMKNKSVVRRRRRESTKDR